MFGSDTWAFTFTNVKEAVDAGFERLDLFLVEDEAVEHALAGRLPEKADYVVVDLTTPNKAKPVRVWYTETFLGFADDGKPVQKDDVVLRAVDYAPGFCPPVPREGDEVWVDQREFYVHDVNHQWEPNDEFYHVGLKLVAVSG